VFNELVPQFQPSQVIAEAPAAAARAVFGNELVVSGCWFHFAHYQALVKRMRKLGLLTPLLEDSRLKTLFICLLSLPVLPVDEVRSGFEDVKSTLYDQSPAKSLMQQLLRYVEKQWLGLTSPISVHRDFPHATIRPGVESFHAALLQRVKVPHPNLFAFLGHLQKATIDNQSFGFPYRNPTPAFSSPAICSRLFHFYIFHSLAFLS